MPRLIPRTKIKAIKKSKKVGWAIIGLGKQAERIAQAINASNNGRLEAVIDEDLHRAKNFAAHYKAPSYSNSYPVFLKRVKIDAVFIASPNYQHARQSLLAIKNRKSVLCEKPLTLSLKDGLMLKKALQKNKVNFGVGFHLRHHPLAQEAKQLIISGKIGKLILVEMSWSIGELGRTKLPPLNHYMVWREDLKKSGGGTIMARGVHLFDLLRFITGLEIQQVTAVMDRNIKKEVDELAIGILNLDSAFATLITSRRLPCAKNQIIIYGTKGRLILNNILATDSVGRLEWFNGKKTLIKKSPKYNLYQKEIEDFGRLLKGQSGTGANLNDGLKTVAVTEAFYQSAQTHKTSIIKNG